MECYSLSDSCCATCDPTPPPPPLWLLRISGPPNPKQFGAKMQFPLAYPRQLPRTERVPNPPPFVHSPLNRAPFKILLPLSFRCKQDDRHIFLDLALEGRYRVISNLLAVEDRQVDLFSCGLQTIRLKINWPGYEEFTHELKVPKPSSTGNRGCVMLLVAIADAYDTFLKSRSRRGVVCANSYWSVSAKRDRYTLANLVPLSLRHCGADVFQVDVLFYRRSSMQ